MSVYKMIPTAVMLALALTFAGAQSISGTVTENKTGRPLAGANIFIEGKTLGTTSDTEGNYRLKIPSDMRKARNIVVTYVGYYDFVRRLDFPLKKSIQMDITLTESLLSMDQIVVTGTRTERFLKDTPVTTQVIKGEQLRESGSNDISQILAEVTGITVNESPRFGSGIDMQGFGSDHILLMVDGMKAIGRLNGHLDLSQFDAPQIERIELVKGAASALYGSQAMGGVINIVTKKPSQKFALSANALAGSYGRYDGNITVSTPIASWHPKFSQGTRLYAGYDLDSKTSAQDGRGYNKQDAGLTLQKAIHPSLNMDIQFNYFQEEQGRRLNDFFEEKVRNKRFAAQTKMHIDSLLSWNTDVGMEYSYYDHRYDEVVRSSGFVKESDPTTDGLLKGDLLLNRSFAKNDVTLGYNFEYEDIQSRRIDTDSRSSVLHSAFFQDEYKACRFFTLLAGGRIDAHSIYGNQFSPKISMMISPTRMSRIRFSYGHGFRAPSFKELYLDLYVADVNLRVLGNPLLKPENSRAFNLDYELWNNNNYHLRLNFFYNRIRDLISDIRMESVANDLRYTYINFDEASTWGGEWDMKYFPSDWLEFTLGYSYLDSWEKSTRAPLSGKIMHRAHGSFLFTLPGDMKLSLRANYFGTRSDRLINDATGEVSEEIFVPDYLLVHMNLGAKLPWHLHVNGGVKNITNYINKTWGPMPGREWYVGLSYSL